MRLDVWLGIFFVGGLLVLGIVQTTISQDESAKGVALAGAAVSDIDQQQLNLCMNECMRGCVTSLETQDPCRGACEKSCGG